MNEFEQYSSYIMACQLQMGVKVEVIKLSQSYGKGCGTFVSRMLRETTRHRWCQIHILDFLIILIFITLQLAYQTILMSRLSL